MQPTRINPSILSADFAALGAAIGDVTPAADWVHVDVMDAHFVPNLTLGLPVVEALLKVSELPLDCHLMIEDPDLWAPRYAEAGAGSVTVHWEAVRDQRSMPGRIQEHGARAGLAVKPGTELSRVTGDLAAYDMLLVMTVEPGFGGQSFLADQLPKIRAARRWLDDHGLELWLQVDGGVSASTIEACAEAGADCFVAGSAVYGAADPAAAVEALRGQADRVRGPVR